MRHPAACVALVVLLFGATPRLVRADYVTLDLIGLTNLSFQDVVIPAVAYYLNGATFPTGAQTFNGVPFAITGPNAPGVLNSWNAMVDADHTLTIPVNMFGVDAVHTLINTWWGLPGPTSYASLTFTGSSTTWTVDLVGNVDIRGYNPGYGLWIDTINGTTTQQAWTNGAQRLDQQLFDLPNAFLSETLVSITLRDFGTDPYATSALVWSRVFLSGVTVEASGAVPEPGSLVSLAVGWFLWRQNLRRRTRTQCHSQ